MREEVIRRVLAMYGIRPVAMLPPQRGYRNQSWPVLVSGGQRLNLIVYKREPHMARTIRNAHAVAAAAHAAGLPVRVALDPRIAVIRASDHTRFAGLYAYLPGYTIPWESYTKTHIKLLGQAMSDMHAAWAGQSFAVLPSAAGVCAATLAAMQHYFEDAGVRAAMHAKLGLSVDPAVCTQLAGFAAWCGQLPRQQVLHMDLVRGNVLFDQPAAHRPPVLTGILDFEKTAWGHPLFDIARTLAFLLVDCRYKTQAKIRKYFLYSGYAKRGQAALPPLITVVNGRRLPLLEHLVSLFLLHDFYKFLRHNPYESLGQNWHFGGTRRLLLERWLIR